MPRVLQRNEAWLNKDLTPTERFAAAIEEIIKEINEMTTNANLFLGTQSVITPVKVYTSPESSQGGKGTAITQFMATDPAGAATYSVYIGTSATASNKVISSRTAAIDGDSPISILNGLVMPGDSIFVEASAANTIVLNISGIERR